jgi:threonine/homoserine/homoserine lactone efflux protein
MMSVETLLLFALTEFLLSLTPGPAVLLVLGLSIRGGARLGLAASAGILATNVIYFGLSALGVGALIVASGTLFTVVKWVGAAYLAWLGIQMIRPLVRHLVHGEPVDAASMPKSAPPSAAVAFRRAMILQAANPKNLAFFVALLPQFVTPGEGVGMQLVLLGVVSVAVELPILVAYAVLAAASTRFIRARVILWIEGIAGGILVGLGAALAAARR